MQERVFEKLFKAASIATFSQEERTSYEDSLKHFRDIKNIADTHREEGIEEGIEIGEKRGEIKGAREKRNIKVAREFKALGIDPAIIAKGTGLTEEEINNL